MNGFRRVAAVLSMVALSLSACSDDPDQADPQAISDESALFPPPEATTRANVERGFSRLSNGDRAAHVRESFAEGATFVINGPPSVAGSWTGKEAIVAGLDRLFSVIPVHQFTIQSIQVSNGPDQVNARAVWSDNAQIDEEQALPARGVNSIAIGPQGITREEMTIGLDDPNALE